MFELIRVKATRVWFGVSFERKLMIALIAIFLYGTTTLGLLIWKSYRSSNIVERSRLAHEVLDGYQQLSSDTYELYKVVGARLMAGGPLERRFDVLTSEEVLISRIQDRVTGLRNAIAEEIAFIGKRPGENEQEELNRFAFIARRIAYLIREYKRVKSIQEGQATLTDWQQLYSAIDDTLDKEFRAAVKAGVADEMDETKRSEQQNRDLIAVTHKAALAATTVATLLLISFSLLLLRSIRRPMSALNRAASAFAAGQLGHRIDVVGDDEFARLSASFNEMAAELEMRRRIGEENEASLKRAVAERTAQLELLNERLSAIDRARRHFLADIGHDLRTPLTIIRGESDIMLRGREKSSCEYRDALSRILEQAQQTGRLIEDLLFVARSEAGLARLDLRPVDFFKLLARLCQDMRRLADERGVIIALDNRAALATIGADEHRMQQVLLVLLDNAIRYARPNGRITVALETAPDGLSVRISDDGIGIHAGDLPFVFERFFRGRNAEGSYTFGSGLGLPLAKAIVEAHAGKLTIESEQGVGTQATIRLPGRFDARAVP